MNADFPREYAELSKAELLHLASDRQSLTDAAKSALDREMRNRNLTAEDVRKQESFVKKSQRRETIIQNRKLFGSRHGLRDWVYFVLGTTIFITAVTLLTLWLDAR
jgi:hypothetical protein